MTTNPPEGGEESPMRELASTLISITEMVRHQLIELRVVLTELSAASHRAEHAANETLRIEQENQQLIRDLIEELRRDR